MFTFKEILLAEGFGARTEEYRSPVLRILRAFGRFIL